MNKKSQASKAIRTKAGALFISKKAVLFVTVIIIVFVVVILINQDYGFMEDQRKAREFKPSPEIEALVFKMNLTDKGKTILYASSPQLKDKIESVRTDSQQMKKDLKEGLISEWYAWHDSNV